MSDMIHGEKPPDRAEVGQHAERKKGNSLSFPSVAFMGIAVFLVVLMLVLLGWKIVNLENEKARINSERRLLERDKLAYAKILEELPDLEDKRQNLMRDFNELNGKVQSNQTILTSLITQKDASRSELDKAKAANKQVQEEINTARETVATLQGEIRTKRPELENLKQKVGALQEEEKTLRTKSDHLQKEVSKLQADVSGLDQQKQNKKQVLEQMSQDASILQSLSTRFGTIADGLEKTRTDADSAIQGWKTQAQFLSTEFGNLTNTRKELQSIFRTTEQVLKDLQSATQKLSGGVGQIQKSADILDKETQRLSKSVDGSANNLQGVLATLSKEREDLGKAVSAINGYVGSLQAKITSVDGATSRFLETSKEVGNLTKDLSTARSGLVSELPSLKELILRLQAVDQALKMIERRLPQEPAGEKGQ